MSTSFWLVSKLMSTKGNPSPWPPPPPLSSLPPRILQLLLLLCLLLLLLPKIRERLETKRGNPEPLDNRKRRRMRDHNARPVFLHLNPSTRFLLLPRLLLVHRPHPRLLLPPLPVTIVNGRSANPRRHHLPRSVLARLRALLRRHHPHHHRLTTRNPVATSPIFVWTLLPTNLFLRMI